VVFDALSVCRRLGSGVGDILFPGKTKPGHDVGVCGYWLALQPGEIAAFREGAGTGFLSLCIPFYALYFVFKIHDNDTLKVLYGVAFVLNFLLRFIKPD
jgi:hypothetical protein